MLSEQSFAALHRGVNPQGHRLNPLKRVRTFADSVGLSDDQLEKRSISEFDKLTKPQPDTNGVSLAGAIQAGKMPALLMNSHCHSGQPTSRDLIWDCDGCAIAQFVHSEESLAPVLNVKFRKF
jgi:hypothetical protein